MNKSNPEVVGDKIPHAVDPRGVNIVFFGYGKIVPLPIGNTQTRKAINIEQTFYTGKRE